MLLQDLSNPIELKFPDLEKKKKKRIIILFQIIIRI